jgi:hypothetical protein
MLLWYSIATGRGPIRKKGVLIHITASHLYWYLLLSLPCRAILKKYQSISHENRHKKAREKKKPSFLIWYSQKNSL